MKARRSRRLPAVLLTIGALSACQRKPPDLTPEGAVRELLDRIDRIETDPTEARAVYDLLSAPTRQNLIDRARRASTTSGRDIPPQDMLAPGRFSLRFEPRKMHTRVADDRAVVDVTGIDPETDRAEVPCVLEEGRWRIEIPLPPLAPAEKRPEPG